MTEGTQAWRLPRLEHLNTRGCGALRTVHLAVDSLDALQWELEGCPALERPVLEVSLPSSFPPAVLRHIEALLLPVEAGRRAAYEKERIKKKRWQGLQDRLIAACEQGDFKAAQKAVAGGAKVTLPGSAGKRPLGAAVWGMNREVVSFVKQGLSEEEKPREQKRAEQDLQDRLTLACEQGDVKAVQKAVRLGAQVRVGDSSGKQPLGAAAWGMNPEVVNYLTEEMKGIAVMSWEEVKSHNLKHYQEVFIFKKFKPQTWRKWHQLLLKMNRSPFLAAKHLAEVRMVWPDDDTSSWEKFVSRVGGRKGMSVAGGDRRVSGVVESGVVETGRILTQLRLNVTQLLTWEKEGVHQAYPNSFWKAFFEGVNP